jgi:hypothetical protein
MSEEKDLKNLSPEELKLKQQEMLEEFMKKNTKEISVPELSSSYKKDALFIIKELVIAQKEVEEKLNSFVSMYKIIDEKIELLTSQGKIQLNDQDYKKIKDSFLEYEKFLNQVLQEVTSEIVFYSNLVGEKPLEKITVFKNAPDDAVLFLNDKLKSTKKYAKNTIKDLRIGYSRYFVDLQEQIRRLDYLVLHTKAEKKD